jgi:hypothetical protein
MFHSTAAPLKLLHALQQLQEFTLAHGFALAGGTSLALRFGHRLSVDLDFFCVNDFDPLSLAKQCSLGPESITGFSSGTLQAIIDQVKVEFIRHDYPQLAPFDRMDNICLWSLPDVAAMKLNAIANGGSKKDFFDIATLLNSHDLDGLIKFYKEKYRPASLLMLIRSLSWFEDAEEEPDPITLIGESWFDVKLKIEKAIRTLI